MTLKKLINFNGKEVAFWHNQESAYPELELSISYMTLKIFAEKQIPPGFDQN